jgi:hypothetical protein
MSDNSSLCEGKTNFIEDVIEVICEGCYDNFCKKGEKDLLYCMKRNKEDSENDY